MDSRSAEKFLFKSVIVRAIKDYIYPPYKKEIQNWVVTMDGAFKMCAVSMEVHPTYLRRIMVDKMIEIDTYGTARLFSDKTIIPRMR